MATTTRPRLTREESAQAGPHPEADRVVGTDVHSYDPSRLSYGYAIPAMRPSQDASSRGRPSDPYPATPIFDELYAEYRRAFRALPGDRTGEEELSAEAMRAIWRTTPTAGGRWDAGTTSLRAQAHYTRTAAPAALPTGRGREGRSPGH
ncbi:hypothetical protein ACFV3R_32735 [Streptomyces sp. NPDC059740]|uniref:hypothetical protein n=1 Tax=Streptomyces sp. NPDC059740 TaxID=3346926 RepID=UPI003657309E